MEQSTADSSQSANSESSDDETSSTGGVTETTPLPEVPTATPEPLPTPTFTTTPVPGTALIVGQPARIVAPNGLNMRQSATASSQLVLQLGTGQLVDITAGPSSADGYVWWQVVDQQGNQGWVAEGDSETVWLSPSVGAPQAVSRPPQVGDRVRVTMESGLQLTLRALPGTDGPLVTRVNPGTEFTVLNGPQRANGFSWYQIRSDNGTILGWAAASDAQGQDRWLSPIE
ncbi:MAG: SH3 domain-containing protein [Chloroflexota bacterium]